MHGPLKPANILLKYAAPRVTALPRLRRYVRIAPAAQPAFIAEKQPYKR